MAIESVKEAVLSLILQDISQECSNLCKKTPTSLFRKIPVDKMAEFSWEELIKELTFTAPTMLRVVSSIAVRIQNQVTSPSHYPGICAAVAVMLKERNKAINQGINQCCLCSCIHATVRSRYYYYSCIYSTIYNIHELHIIILLIPGIITSYRCTIASTK